MVKTDVLIVGGGPAGLAAAIAARQKNFAVTVIDCAHPPIDKPCGEGLMPDAVAVLQTLGIQLSAYNSAPFAGISFIAGSTVARAMFPAVSGFGVRRTTLHALMVERARNAGVKLFWNTTFNAADAANSARWIIGADGMSSAVRRWAGFAVKPASVRRFGYRRHYPVAPWSETVDVHWGRKGQVYITPVAADSVCVAVISQHQQLRLDEALRSFPGVERRLRGLIPTTPERGSVTECRRLARVTRGNVALIGDASGTVDAITGEGLALSFKQAIALADALEANDLSIYEARHKRIARMPALMANLMLRMDDRARVQRLAIGALAAQPRVFSKLLEMHIGAKSPAEKGISCVSTSAAI